jgi:hypothetical protein
MATTAQDGLDPVIHYADAAIRVIMGVEPLHVEQYDLVPINPDERVQVRGDRNNAPNEMVDRFVYQMSTDRFPPPVFSQDALTVDGNTRVKARKKREERYAHAVVVPISYADSDEETQQRFRYLGLVLNSVNGKPLDRAEQREMVRDGLLLGQSSQEISYRAGVPVALVNRVRNEIAAEDKMRRVGLDPKTVREQSLRGLGRRDVVELNDEPYRELATLAADAGFNVGEITALATTVRETGSDDLGLERIEREREANAQRIEDRRRGDGGHPPAARQLRQRLGFVANRPPESLVETNIDKMVEHLELVQTAIGVLQNVETRQKALIEQRSS